MATRCFGYCGFSQLIKTHYKCGPEKKLFRSITRIRKPGPCQETVTSPVTARDLAIV